MNGAGAPGGIGTMKHSGKVALVTGGSSGIGQAVALRLAADGAEVANFDVAAGLGTEQLAAGMPGSVHSYRCDVAEPEAIRAGLEQVRCALGEPAILVHAAAALFLMPFEQLTHADWRRAQAVGQDAAFHLTQQVLPAMRAAGWGRIILVASSTFWVGGMSMTHYVTTKGALMGFAHGLAGEVGAYGVTVNCIAPGLTLTPNTESSLPPEFFERVASSQSIRRIGKPSDQAGVVSFLASDDAAFITGQTWVVDGGQVRT